MLEKKNFAAKETERPRPLGVGWRELRPTFGERRVPRASSPRRTASLDASNVDASRRSGSAAQEHGNEKQDDDGNTLHSRRHDQVDQMPLLSTSAHAMKPPIGEPSSSLSIVRRRGLVGDQDLAEENLPEVRHGHHMLLDRRAGIRIAGPFDRPDDGRVDRAVALEQAGRRRSGLAAFAAGFINRWPPDLFTNCGSSAAVSSFDQVSYR